MSTKFFSLRYRYLLTAALLITCVAAKAAPFAITYRAFSGQSSSPIPGIRPNEIYQATFIMENGGNEARGQTWTGSQLTCAIFRINNSGNVIIKHDMASAPAGEIVGQVATDATTRLTQVFSRLFSGPLQAASYTASGIALVPPLSWSMLTTSVLSDQGGSYPQTDRYFIDRGTGVGLPNDPSLWSAPYRVSGPCDDTPLTALPGAPRNIVAIPGDGQIAVRWQAAPASPGSLAAQAYRVAVFSAGSPTPQGCTVQAPATTCLVTGLENEVGYTVAVFAIANGAEAAAASVGPITPSARSSAPGAVAAVPTLDSWGVGGLIAILSLSAGLGAFGLSRRHLSE